MSFLPPLPYNLPPFTNWFHWAAFILSLVNIALIATLIHFNLTDKKGVKL